MLTIICDIACEELTVAAMSKGSRRESRVYIMHMCIMLRGTYAMMVLTVVTMCSGSRQESRSYSRQSSRNYSRQVSNAANEPLLRFSSVDW